VARLALPAILGGLAFAGAVSPLPSSAQPAAATSPFAELVRRADAARSGGRLDDAAALYREALKQRPSWPDGWWYLGTLAYDGDRPRECVAAFRSLLALKPELRAAWALRGLCAFELGEYEAARGHLAKALAAGPLADESMGRVVAYHVALLAIQAGAFEAAIQPLAQLLQAQEATPELADACGLVLLRRAQVPKKVSAGDRAYLRSVGGAYCAHLARRAADAQRLFAELVARFPDERHLHYGYGLALAQAGDALSLEQFQREIELFPDDLLARVELAFGLLARGRASEALPPAERAVALAPRLFAAHLALGRALVETGAVERGLGELERAAQLEPGIVEIHWALANAYAGAGRDADAARERETVRALEARRSGRDTPAPSRP
jgi:tetratricopeptide (TPR) repeat protein